MWVKETWKHHQKQVVILIDEDNKPISDNMDQPQMAKEAGKTLKAFYTLIKDNDAHIRVAFLAGVTKFSKVSVFSGINNIEDISPASRICHHLRLSPA